MDEHAFDNANPSSRQIRGAAANAGHADGARRRRVPHCARAHRSRALALPRRQVLRAHTQRAGR